MGTVLNPECVKVYRIACFSTDQRKAVWERDRGVCQTCSTDTKTLGGGQRLFSSGKLWQADHRRALHTGDGSDVSLFSLDNLFTICTPCHRTKNKQEAAARAEKRRVVVILKPSEP